MKGFDFVITGLQTWDIPIGSNAIDIAKEIAQQNRVLYVNSPLDMMTLLRNGNVPEIQYRKQVLQKKKPTLRQINENLWVLDLPFFIWSVNALPTFLFNVVNKYNNKKMYTYINKVLTQLQFKNIIHFIDNDIYRSFYAPDMLATKSTVYYRRDNLLPFTYWKKHAPRLEPQLIEKCDVVVCNSPQLADVAKRNNPRSYNVGQGVDLAAYNPALYTHLPQIITNIPQPRIGYIGDINSLRLDVQLLYEVAKSRPDYSFVMIGKEDAVFTAHEIHQLPNIHFIGSIAKQDVPAYMNALDVCINPQLINEITIGNYPRKVDEYLAMGKPVVATHTHTMELFKEHVYLCNNVLQYQTAIDKALTENNATLQEARIAFAHSHSWKNNVAAIYHHILENLK